MNLLEHIYDNLCIPDHSYIQERFPNAKDMFGLKYLPRTWVNKDFWEECKQNDIYISKLMDRMIIPIYDHSNKLVALSGRIVSDQDEREKYYNTIFGKSEMLFRSKEFDNAIKSFPFVRVVEGYADVIRISERHLYNVVANMGTHLSDTQIEILNSYGLPVHIMYDGDKAGKRGMNKISFEKFKVPVFVEELEMDYDPDDWMKAGFSLPKPIPYEEWWLKHNWELAKSEDHETELERKMEYLRKVSINKRLSLLSTTK